MFIALIVIACYLIGSISPGIIIAKLKGKGDIRQYGSGGTGATNVNRTLGTKYGLLVLLFDCLKSIIPLLILKFMNFDENLIYFSAIAVMIGHIFPIYHKFKGGKGVATALGVLLVIDWKITLILLVIFVLIVWIFRYISLGSIIAVISFPLISLSKNDRDLVLFSAFLALIIIWTHKANIMRLLAGNENRFSFKKS